MLELLAARVVEYEEVHRRLDAWEEIKKRLNDTIKSLEQETKRGF